MTCLALVVLLVPGTKAVTAQSLSGAETTPAKAGKPKRSPMDWNVKAVSPLIDQQAQRLWRIYDKYERDDVPRFLWVDEKLWYDLFADRRYLAGSVDYVFPKNTVRAVWISQDKMERELLM